MSSERLGHILLQHGSLEVVNIPSQVVLIDTNLFQIRIY